MRTPRQPGSAPDEDDTADGGRAKERVKQFEQQRGLPPRQGPKPAAPPTPAAPPSPRKKAR
jgi:hypothetical protein